MDFGFTRGTAWQDLSSNAGIPDRIADANGNTQIQTEESPDEDVIRFDVGGVERLILFDAAMSVNTQAGIGFPGGFGVNSTFVGTPGNSLYFGHVGNSEDFIGYSNNTFYFKDSPGGADVSDPNLNIGGGSVTANAFIGDGSSLTGISVTQVSDADSDTKIQMEETADEDTIRIDVAGTEVAKIDNKTLQLGAPGESLFIGLRAGEVEDGQFRGNTFVGHNSGRATTTGSLNAGYGAFSLINNVDGNENTALGRESMVVNSSGSDNTATGYVSLRSNDTGNNNSAYGAKALVLNNTGNDNAGFGFDALFNNSTGNSNTGMGTNALRANTTGSRNTALGYNADVSANNLTNATAIGANTVVSKDSSIVLGDAANVGIGTSSPDAKLHVVGNVRIVDGNQATGKILVSDANGVASWQDNAGTAVPDTALPVPIRFHGAEIFVHPTENATDVDWTTAQTTCSNLTAFGFSDWYLPSRLELDAMYKQSFLITGLVDTAMVKYWSNTELDTNNAYSQRLDYGGPDPDPKTDTTGHNCRCIRKNP